MLASDEVEFRRVSRRSIPERQPVVEHHTPRVPVGTVADIILYYIILDYIILYYNILYFLIL